MQPHVAPVNCQSPSRTTSSRVRRGFTLVELLVVITIIGILIALVSTAVASAMTTAREASILAEINGLASAMTTYKTDNGGVPPDFSPYDPVSDQNWSVATGPEPNYVPAVFMKHLNNRFSSAGVFSYAAVEATVRANYPSSVSPSGALEISLLDPAEALVFWLGGFSDRDNGRLLGFNADKNAPFAAGGIRTDPLYDFDQTRLHDGDNDGWFEYYPVDPDSVEVPYVYFASRGDQSYGPNPLFAMYPQRQTSTVGYAVPYFNRGTTPMEPRGFQIIACGVRDNSYSQTSIPRSGVPFYPSGQGAFLAGDDDNLTNFHAGSLDKGLD